MSAHAPDAVPDDATPLDAPPKPLPWHHRAPILTMALNSVLILAIFLTRERWGAWQVEHDLPLPEPLPTIWEIVVSPDANVMTIFTAKSITSWDLRSGRETGRFAVEMCSSRGQRARSHDARYRIVGTGLLSMFGALRQITGAPASTRSKGFSDTSRPLLVDLATGRVVSPLDGHTGEVVDAAFSPDGRRVVTASDDGTARVWDVSNGKGLLVLGGHERGVARVAYSPDGGRLLTASVDGSVRIWDARTGEPLVGFEAGKSCPQVAVFAADGRTVVAFSYSEGTVRVLDASTGDPVATVRPVRRIEVSPDGGLFATGHNGGTVVELRDAPSGRKVVSLEGHGASVFWTRFSADGRLILTWDRDDEGRVWDVGTGRCLFAMDGLVTGGSFEFFPDGERILARGRLAPAVVVDAHTGKALAEIGEAYRHRRIMSDDRVYVHEERGRAEVWRRVRPERWWGVLWLWHFWVIVALGVALAWSGWRDLRRLRRTS
ncbi:MAG: WD40 repeat domain-containing protein [Planctomycetota bacterium]|jgi:WD40 repeat protein